jgi:hypothetical protein
MTARTTLKLTLSTAILLLTGFALTGCKSDVAPPIEGRNDPWPARQIHFASEELRRDTAVGQPIATRDEAGILHVMVPIRSAINKTLYVDYRYTFFDGNRQIIDQSGWMNRTLEQNTPDRIEFNSTSNRAADFQVDFRYPRIYTP